MPKHALVIGGTGMLKDVTLHLLKDYDIVSVVARYDESFDSLKKNAGKIISKLNPIKQDYKDYLGLTNSLLKSAKDFGDFALCVSWIHSTAPAAPMITAKILNLSAKCEFYEVLNSESQYTDRENEFKAFDNIYYHQVVLGYVSESGNTSRWLTDKEISNGVIEAVKSGVKRHVIGILENRNTG